MYKIPFIHTLDLVRNRKVFLLKGQAYVPYTEIISVITGAFRTHLSESMSYVKKNIHILEQDERIMDVVADFDKRHTGNDYNKKDSSAAVTADQLPVVR
jgi:DNA primase large subunit